MKSAKFVPVLTIIMVAGFLGLVLIDDVVAGGTGICVTPDGRNVPCSSPPSGSGPGAQHPQPRQPTQQELDRESEDKALDLNDIGVEAFEQGNLVKAINAFSAALEYAPHDPAIADNLQAAEEAKSAREAQLKGAREAKAARDKAKGKLDSPADYKLACVETSLRGVKLRGGNLCDPGMPSDYGRSCQLCGKKVISDVEIGMKHSANKPHYIRQALQGYYNCTRGFLDQCKNSCGHDLFSGIRRDCGR